MADCNEVLRELYHFLDGEIDSSRREHIAAHIEGCLDCLDVFDFHAELRMVVAQKCTESIPEGLKARILEVLGNEDGPFDPSSEF